MTHMKKEVFKKSPLQMFASALIPALFTVTIIIVMLYGMQQTEQSSKAEGLRLLKEGLTRAAVTCYAVEGRYPESLSYIEERYGVRIDETKYIVYYDVFASNILPDITVIEK